MLSTNDQHFILLRSIEFWWHFCQDLYVFWAKSGCCNAKFYHRRHQQQRRRQQQPQSMRQYINHHELHITNTSAGGSLVNTCISVPSPVDTSTPTVCLPSHRLHQLHQHQYTDHLDHLHTQTHRLSGCEKVHRRPRPPTHTYIQVITLWESTQTT